ncbi:MAG: tyrosine-type recombinase/integrase, partial [Streptosporangiales bacterium]|nr:tyrosine-type recombinase/integrase [Streptosporangiales bacterium]
SWLAERGVPLTDIKDLMGHASLRSTERYLHAAGTRLDRAREALQSWPGDGTPRLRTLPGGREKPSKTRRDLRQRDTGS